jgi:hypothetical protein
LPGARLNPSRWPLHFHFALLLLLFTTATVVALVVVRRETRNEALDSAREDVAFASQRAAMDLQDSLLTARAVVDGTAANPAVATLLDVPEACNLSFANVGPLVGSINVLAPGGEVGCSSAPLAGAGFGEVPWVIEARSGPVTTAPFAHPDTGEAVFVIAAPVDGGRAIFAAVLELAPIAAALGERYGGPRDLEFVVVAPDSATVISRSVDASTWAGATLDAGALAALAAPERADFDGTTRLYATAAVEGDGWLVHAGADKAEALLGADRVFERFSVAIVAGLVVALLASLGVYLLILRPIRRLSRGIAAAAANPTNGSEISSHGPAELAALAIEFNRLTASVREEFSRREEAEAERDELRQQLNRVERLESLGQLAGGMAHDFNNMLGVMLNYAVFVKEEVEQVVHDNPSRWEPVLEDLAAIELAVDRSAGLTRQLLAFARCDVARPSNLEVNETVDALGSLLTRTLGENVHLKIALADTVGPVQMDPRKLEQVLVNLAANGRDAMPSGGTLAIDTANVDVDEEYAASRPGLVPGRYVRVRVSDTGTGMEPDIIERAFEPLFTTKSIGRGTGLGLSTVYGIVNQAGGHVSIYSEVGQGTTFNLLLPVADRPAAEEAVVPGAVAVAGLRGTETVLVVEDDSTLLDVANRILARNGYRTLTALDGTSAIELARRHPGVIELLVTDMVLPDMSGRDLASMLADLRPDIRVVYASGYAAPILAARSSLGADSIVLEKPFPATDLLAKVRLALAS